MTLIMFAQYTGHAILLMDTLVTTPDGTAVALEQKFWPFPQLNAVVAATGNREVAASWCEEFVRDGITDVEALHAAAPAQLRAHDAKLREAYGEIGPTTVRVFAYPKNADHLVRYEYNSRNGYEGTIHAREQFHIRPAPLALQPRGEEGPDEMIAFAQLIQAEQDRRPRGERVAIGGDLLCAIIQRSGVDVRHVHRFNNFSDTLRQIAESTPPSRESEADDA